MQTLPSSPGSAGYVTLLIVGAAIFGGTWIALERADQLHDEAFRRVDATMMEYQATSLRALTHANAWIDECIEKLRLPAKELANFSSAGDSDPLSIKVHDFIDTLRDMTVGRKPNPGNIDASSLRKLARDGEAVETELLKSEQLKYSLSIGVLDRDSATERYRILARVTICATGIGTLLVFAGVMGLLRRQYFHDLILAKKATEKPVVDEPD